jgi:hypothetical protein
MFITLNIEKNIYKLIGSCLLIGGLAFGWLLDAHLSPIEKFAKAFPPSAEVRISYENLETLTTASVASLKSFKENYESRLMMRALTCSQGSSISRFDSVEKIKKLEIDRECLKEQDSQLLQLIGLKLVGIRLSEPPLRPMVKLGTPSIIHSVDGIEPYMVKAASKAGVAVLRGRQNEFFSLEIPSGKKITSLPTMPEASQANFSLSPNGRVLAIPVYNKDIRFLDVETGQDLWLAKDFTQFDAWLPEVQSALVRKYKSEKNEVILIDFKMGEIKSYLTAPDGFLSWALPISELPSRVLLGFNSELSLVENTRTAKGVEGYVIKSLKIQSREGVNPATLTLMLNGETIAFSTNSQNFMLVNLKTGEEKIFETKDLLLGRYTAKLSEETLLVDSYNHSQGRGVYQPWVLNIKDSTLSPVETTEGTTGEVYPLGGRTGFIRRERQKMWVGDDLQIGKPELLDTIIEGRKLEMQLEALVNIERVSKVRTDAMNAAREISQIQQKLGMVGSSNTNLTLLTEKVLQDQLKQLEHNQYAASVADASATASVPSALAIRSDYSLAANEARRLAISEATKRMIGVIPSNAQIEAIGVYEAKDKSPSGINVIIKKSDRPIVLILSSSELVRWNLIKEPGVNLAAVIATGTRLPQVTGVGDTKIVIMKANKYYPYQQKDLSYKTLNEESIMWTGKQIDRFQGSYSGSIFIVGNGEDLLNIGKTVPYSAGFKCSNHYAGQISRPLIYPKTTKRIKQGAVLKLFSIGTGEDPVFIEVNGVKQSPENAINLKPGKNVVDFVVQGEGEVHSWHARLMANLEIIFEHKQDRLPAFSCKDELYRYRMNLYLE